MTDTPVDSRRAEQAALLSLLNTVLSEPLSFSPVIVANLAERARDMIVALDSSLTAAEKQRDEALSLLFESAVRGRTAESLGFKTHPDGSSSLEYTPVFHGDTVRLRGLRGGYYNNSDKDVVADNIRSLYENGYDSHGLKILKRGRIGQLWVAARTKEQK